MGRGVEINRRQVKRANVIKEYDQSIGVVRGRGGGRSPFVRGDPDKHKTQHGGKSKDLWLLLLG